MSLYNDSSSSKSVVEQTRQDRFCASWRHLMTWRRISPPYCCGYSFWSHSSHQKLSFGSALASQGLVWSAPPVLITTELIFRSPGAHAPPYASFYWWFRMSLGRLKGLRSSVMDVNKGSSVLSFKFAICFIGFGQHHPIVKPAIRMSGWLFNLLTRSKQGNKLYSLLHDVKTSSQIG
jgi:hypothetical protein